MIVAALLLCVVAMGAITIGRLAVLRSDAQRAADAAALAALHTIRERGMPFDAGARAAAEALARRNAALPAQFQWRVTEAVDAVEIQVTATIAVDQPTLVFAAGTSEVRARAVARLPQRRFDEAERRLPRLAMVLDYSGSMSLPFSGGGARAIDVLEDSVEGLLAAGLDIDYGAAFYSSAVFRTVAIGAGAPNQIISTMNTYDAGGTTNTGAALAAARNLLLAAPDTGRHVLLVSDGEPCCEADSFARGRAAAVELWNAGVTIYTLEIRRAGSSPALDQFMTDVAGSPSSRRDRNFHFVATTPAALVDQFRNIVASIVCKVGPVTPAPSDPALVRVYLEQGGSERALQATDDLARDRALVRFRWEPADATVRLTAAACDQVLDAGAEVIVRFDRPALTE
jgi:Flp pilus assembly protein TadG